MAPERHLPRPQVVRTRWLLQLMLPTVVGGLAIFALVTVLGKLGLVVLFFFLLPACATVITEFRRRHNNPRLLILVGSLAFIYFGLVTGLELLTHGPATPEYIVVTTTLTLAVLFGFVRSYSEGYLERRFGLRDTPAQKAVEAYTATLRQEIDLGRLRNGLLTTLVAAVRPYSAALWVVGAQDEGDTGGVVAVSSDDPFLTYALQHPSIVELRRLRLDTPLVETLRQQAVEIVLPLASQGELLGLLTLGPRLDRPVYSAEDRDLLVGLARQVAPALRVAQLVLIEKKQARERERIELELHTARTIQQTFLPKSTPALDGWALTEYYQPAREVGGDFYDFLTLPAGKLGLVIGDVTGKGIPAALMMTAARTMIRSVAQQVASPGNVLAQVNELLREDIPPGMFVTCFYAILNPADGRLRYANAGQDLPALRRSDGTVGELRATGMPLGLFPSMSYQEEEATLAARDLVLFYSDGLVEAHDPERAMFGLPRLQSLLGQAAVADGQVLIERLKQALLTFAGAGWEQEDDITLVALHRLAGENQS
jgi:serine phosphatase RsbU (regulator of sigma subunit)